MTLLFDIKLTWYQRSVTLHCSHYLQGLSFCLFFFFFCWNTHSHSHLSLSEVCSSSHLQFSRVEHRHLLPGGSCPSSRWFPAHHGGLTSPWWTNTWNSGSRTRWFADKTGSSKPDQFIRGGWTWTSTIPAFLRQGPYKSYEHCMVMKISLEIDALHWIAIAASKDHLQLVLEIKREESDFSPVAICLWTCIKSGQTPGRVPASFYVQ